MINRQQMSGFVFVVTFLCILIISCLPGSNIHSSSVPFASMDLITHFLMYGFLSYVLYRFLRDLSYPHQLGTVSLIFVVLGPFIYGVVLELVQGFVPERHPSTEDALFNLMGSCLSLILIVLWRKFMAKN